ncbi:conjugative transposon protein TraM [Cesiribacter andamanensis]|uniref:Conjugative transposon TraM protein n=1 Tax=Cesiribacter andamanensis AMV16 TaxID=1279009 RepID=M7N4U0_9BACT|nr:conjugative transposon protein TraM [Cesiribacter andamanensis]EMR02302.1 conjugative transposon TraM protein [Cesiribacter andamanensis AMV16]
MSTERKGIGKRLRRHWLPLSAGLLGLLLLGALALGSIKRFKATTPIASIDPDTPPSGQPSPSRLDRYRKELEEMNRQHARRQRSLETIISMDFGSMGRDESPAEPEREPVAHAPAEREEPMDRTLPEAAPSIARPDLTARRTQVMKPQPQPSAGHPKAPAEPFQTLRVNEPEGEVPHQQQAFYSALVHGDQKLLPNATLCLRLQEEMAIGKHRFPRNTLLYGKLSAAGGGGRLKVRIGSIGTVPLRLQVYDQDYLPGIAYLQEEPLPSALAESRDDALDQMLYSVPYGGVASGLAGLGRNLLRKNRRGKTIFLADGYPLFVAPETE